MFDIGFWELVLLGLVALLVLGPERLPAAARTAGFWLRKMRAMVASVRQEVERELYLEEMKQTLARQSPQEDLRKAAQETSKALAEVEQSVARSDLKKNRLPGSHEEEEK